MSACANLSRAYARTAGDRCQETRRWGWRCDRLALADSRNNLGGTTEVEYIALSEVLLEVLFVPQMQEFVVREVKTRLNHEGHYKGE